MNDLEFYLEVVPTSC